MQALFCAGSAAAPDPEPVPTAAAPPTAHWAAEDDANAAMRIENGDTVPGAGLRSPREKAKEPGAVRNGTFAAYLLSVKVPLYLSGRPLWL